LNVLFAIGGDGTQKGALAVADELERRGRGPLRGEKAIAVIGVPKTIDNDLSFIQRSFGFETAVSTAVEAVTAAHVEARSAINGIGLVKLMGRESGFIAAATTLASNDVNFTLIPEVPFDLEGDRGFLSALKKRIVERRHAVVLAAEGAGLEFLAATAKTDASGNKILPDVGVYLRDRIKEYFSAEKIEVNVKYIDPSYIIRSAPANPNDALYCARLGANAVHAAMAGRTRMIVSLVNDTYVHIPMRVAVSKRNFVDPESALWRDVIETTGMPSLMVNKP
jgi:6-phosphofructokinase 1